ncbi:MAG: flagellar filament capping protein FliD [Treponema sp.]|jgi:flagellar hook-associated protein 2|nr:flagellar filament capping protein FliD [Treponema sp.]
MSDIYIPGVTSRFNSEKLIEDLMKLERIPKERTERGLENLQTQKSYWQEVGRRISSVRDSARLLYSYQNPFSDRVAISSDEGAITASATREASEQTYRFTVKQTAQADRFLSSPLDEKMKIDAGTYSFSVGEDKISINYRGGALRDFVDALNRRSRDKIGASLVTIQSGTKSLLIESKVTGQANRLGFHDDSITLAKNIGMMEQGNDTRRDIVISDNTIRRSSQGLGKISVSDGILNVGARSSASLPLNMSLSADSPMMLRLETATKVETGDFFEIPQPPPGPSVTSGGSVTYGGVTIENEPSFTPIPEWNPPAAPVRNDDMAVLTLSFSDGTSAALPPIGDSGPFVSRQFLLSDVAQGRSIVSLNIENKNTHRDISVGKVEIFDPTAVNDGLRPLNIVSTARDAVITMEGIEIRRPSNNINDIVPGLTLNVRGVSDRPLEMKVSANTEKIKDAIISFVWNYNRLMAEINILTRADERIVDELTNASQEEIDDMKKRLGAFSGDTTLNSFKNNLQRTISAPYSTSLERDLTLLSQIGISTNAAGRSGGYDPARMRGYLEIDENVLNAALESKVPAIKELFANDIDGDLIADTGVAYNVDSLVKPFVEIGGIISLKTGTIDSRMKQDERRINTMEQQLAKKEADLKIQYARMESAYSRMEHMSTSLDNFNQQNRGNR